MRNFLNILSVVVLFAGVVAGVVLVQNEQDIRKSAAPEDKVKICHKTGNGEEFNQIEVAEQAVQAHLDHGDKLTGCDQPSQASSEGNNQNSQTNQNNQPSQTVTPAETQPPQATQESVAQNNNQEQNNSSSNQNTGGNSTTDNEEIENENNSTANNESNTSGNSITNTTGSNTTNNVVNTNTFISPLNKNTFTFQFRLQGINKSGITKNITLTFTKSGKQSLRNLTAVSLADGTFRGTISGLETGNYEVLVKPDTYLANRFKSVNVTSGSTDWNWTASNFRAGDFNNDNVINLLDIGMILAIYNQENVAVNSSNKQYDIDASGIINEADIDIVLGNYSSLNVPGEK